jgi:hypothetical protein
MAAGTAVVLREKRQIKKRCQRDTS